jgi:putative flippase GtrA
MISGTALYTEKRRFFAFAAVGVLNTCFGYGAFALLIWLGAGNDLAVLLGMIAGMLFNFGTIGRVFSARGFARLPHFIGTYALLMIANIAALRFLVAAGTNILLAEAIILAFIVPVSFLAMRFFVFGSVSSPAGEEEMIVKGGGL